MSITSVLVILAALTLVLSPLRVWAILLILTLLYFSPVTAFITLAVLGILYYLIRR